MNISEIIGNRHFTRENIVSLLRAEGMDKLDLLEHAARVRSGSVGKRVWFRGLIEFSNICAKDCLYCGIRKSNREVSRYELTDSQIIGAARFAYENRYGSIVLQSGERQNKSFTERIESLINRIKEIGNGTLGITLSLGEQEHEVYERWFATGTHRYLLRIKTTNPELYSRIYPADGKHLYGRRMECLSSLREAGYQVGTGVMIGLPFQTLDDLAGDLLFFREFDIDMVGMGPYIEHDKTPLFIARNSLIPAADRFGLALKMVAVLRIMMPDINIAAATALQSINPLGREKAVMAGANIVMPNITPGAFRNDYSLYNDKPCVDEEPEECMGCLDARLALTDMEIAYGEWGDSRHFKNQNSHH